MDRDNWSVRDSSFVQGNWSRLVAQPLRPEEEYLRRVVPDGLPTLWLVGPSVRVSLVAPVLFLEQVALLVHAPAVVVFPERVAPLSRARGAAGVRELIAPPFRVLLS